MSRSAVQTVFMRIGDVQIGDVIARSPDKLDGWFEVAHIETLHDGRVAMADEAHRETVTGMPLHLVGLQLVPQPPPG